jgi:hypothetical protein
LPHGQRCSRGMLRLGVRSSLPKRPSKREGLETSAR